MVKEHLLDHGGDVMFLTETWCKPNKTAVVNELTPPGYSYNYIGKCRSAKRGGGVGILYKSEYKLRKTKRYETFEHVDVKSIQTLRLMRVVVIYRPPTTNVQQFLDEFATYVNEIAMTQQDILIVCDFNLNC